MCSTVCFRNHFIRINVWLFIFMASFSVSFISASATRTFFDKTCTGATNIWMNKKWKRHFFFCRWCEKKQPPAETVYINSICLHLVYFVVCPLLSWLNGNLIILFLFSVIYITSCNGIFIKKMLTFFRWNPSKNTLHPGGWVNGYPPTHTYTYIDSLEWKNKHWI